MLKHAPATYIASYVCVNNYIGQGHAYVVICVAKSKCQKLIMQYVKGLASF